MGRTTSFIYFLLIYHYSNALPIQNESENVRLSRQLDFSECCPCPGSGQRSLDHLSASAPGLDDCPCRPRQADSEGASSILFPNALRAAGTFLKPTAKKEDVKPLLHPEVDLASSVLETLREATNEEYRQALARDAIRDAVKMAGLSDSTFRDAAPEESRSIVTIIMNPKPDFDDVIPQASHVQDSRCIHPPLDSAKIGKLKVAQTTPLMKETFRRNKSKQPSLLHRHFSNMDSNVGASNAQEHVVNVEGEQMNSKESSSRDAGLFKLNPIKTQTISNDDDCNDGNDNSKAPLTSNIIKYPFRSPLFQNIKDKKIGQNLKVSRIHHKEDNGDLRVSPSNVNESVLEGQNTIIKEIPNFRKPTLKNILENTRPFNIKHLLKLKDVELLPSDGFDQPRAIDQPKLFSPYALSRKNNGAKVNQRDKSQINLVSNQENDDLNSKTILSKENCSIESKENTQIIQEKPEEENPETEILDTEPNPSNTIFSVDNGQINSDSCESHETPNEDSNKLVLPTIDQDESSTGTTQNDKIKPRKNISEMDEEHFSRTTSDSENSDEPHVSEKNCDTDEEYNPRNASNNLNPTERQKLTEKKNMLTRESSIHENVENLQNDSVETTTANYMSLKPIPLDETLLSIKEKIKNTLENLKIINKDIKGISDQSNYSANVSSYNHNETQLSEIKIEPDLDCISEKSEQIIITFKPEDNTEKQNINLNDVTIQELQKKSDSMLEKEILSNIKSADCEETEKTSEDGSTEINEKESESLDSETSANTQSIEVILPEAHENDTIFNGNSDNMPNICQSNLSKVKSAQKNNLATTNRGRNALAEMDASSSNIVINKLSQDKVRPLGKIFGYPFSLDDVEEIPSLNSDPLTFLKTSVPDIRDILKLDPLPTFEDIQLKVSNLFNTNERDVLADLPPAEDCVSNSRSASKSSMVSDASTANFQIKQPPLRLLDRENLNLDIFQLRPITNPISKLRTPGLDSYKAKLALPKDLSLKPIKFHSSFGDTDGVLSSRSKFTLFPNEIHEKPKVSDVLDSIVEGLPSFDDLRDKTRSNTHELLNTPSFLESFNDKLDDLSDLKSHAENSVKNIQQKLKAARNDLNFRNPIPTSHSLLETIAEKHEDLNDKLKAVHIDFNDRLESMRNSLINPRYPSDDRKKNNIKSFTNLKNYSEDRPLLFKSQRPLQVSDWIESPRRLEEKTATIQASDQRRLKMPAAASMPVSKTVEVPKLNAFTPTRKDAPIFKPRIKSTELPPVRTSTLAAKQAINPFKNSKVRVSFSTTTRPLPLQLFKPRLTSTEAPISRQKSKEKVFTDSTRNNVNLSALKFKDSIGALSETQTSAILAPKTNVNERLGSDLHENGTLENTRNPNILQSRPNAAESSFLAKVKESVSGRRPKTNTAKKFLSNKKDDRASDSDRLRSTPEKLEINTEKPLKDNVSYKCRMVCTRE